MTKILLAGLALALIAVRIGHAQSAEDKKLLASGPLMVNPMPGFSQWIVEYTYTDALKPGDKSQMDRLAKAAEQDPGLAKALKDPQFLFAMKNIRPKRVVVTKTGDIRHEERWMEEGYQEESWRVGNIEVERKPNLQHLTKKFMAGFSIKDFPELEWIDKTNFIGIQDLSGRKCFVFKQDRYDDSHQLQGTAFAYVDSETRYPIQFRFLTQVRQYKVLPAPKTALTIPPDFAQAGRSLEKELKNAVPHLAPP